MNNLKQLLKEHNNRLEERMLITEKAKQMRLEEVDENKIVKAADPLADGTYTGYKIYLDAFEAFAKKKNIINIEEFDNNRVVIAEFLSEIKNRPTNNGAIKSQDGNRAVQIAITMLNEFFKYVCDIKEILIINPMVRISKPKTIPCDFEMIFEKDLKTIFNTLNDRIDYYLNALQENKDAIMDLNEKSNKQLDKRRAFLLKEYIRACRDYIIMFFSFAVGNRSGILQYVKIKHIDLREKNIKILNDKSRFDNWVKVHSVAEYEDSFFFELGEYISNTGLNLEDPLFINLDNGKPLSDKQIKGILKKIFY